MSKLGNTAMDTAGGAAVGSVVPGIGTAAGAAGGLIYGIASNYLGGGGGVETSGGDLSNGPRSNFAYGNTGPLSAAANHYAGVANGMGGAYANQGQGYYNGAWNAQDRSAPMLQGSAQARQAQIAALGGTQQNAAALQAMGTAPTNTGIAAAQLQQGQDAAMRQSLAMASSGRSLGGGASALQQAQFANAGTQQATNQQAAIANLQEQQQNRQMQLSALGAAQQGYGLAGQQSQGLNAMDVGLQAQNAQLRMGQEGVNNQTTATMGGLGQGLGQLGLGEQGLGNQVLTTQLGAGEQYQNSINGNSIAQQGLNNQQQGTYMQGAAGLAGAYAASDRDVKQGIMPAGSVPDQWGNTFGAGANTPSGGYSAGPVQTAYGLNTQQQQSQLGAMQGADANAQFQARVGTPMRQQAEQQSLEYGSPYAAGGRSNYGYPAPPTSPTTQPAQQQGSPTLAQTMAALGGGRGTGAAAYSGGGRQSAFHVSDVTNKKDIKAADDEGWLSRMWNHGGLGIKGGGGEFWHGGGGTPAPSAYDVGQNAGAGMAAAQHAALAQYNPGPYGSIDAAQRAGAGMAQAQQASLAQYAPGPQVAMPVATGPMQDPTAPNDIPTPYGAPPGYVGSDEHSKQKIEALSAQNRSLLSALSAASAPKSQPTGGQVTIAPTPAGAPYPGDVQPTPAPVPPPDQPAIDLRPAQPYSYEYRDPARHGQGRFYGPMAQDLEKTPAGASVVKRAPDGTKMVDTSRLSLVNTGAISDLQRQIAALGGRPAQQAPRGY